MGTAVDGASPWSAHRRRAQRLRERYPFAGEVLGLYLPLLDVWDEAWAAAREQRPEDVPAWALTRVLPGVVEVTRAHGPGALGAAVAEAANADHLEKAFAAWLEASDVSPVEAYLAGACLRPVLVALEPVDKPAPASADARHCPRCGAAPQLSFRAPAEDPLVRGGRRLSCSRCAHTWGYSSSACASCGETSGEHRTIYAEHRASGPVVGRDDRDTGELPMFAHVRVDACTGCHRYLLDVDLGLEPAAVPEVDELAAIPLALYATDQGLEKITPNLMGF